MKLESLPQLSWHYIHRRTRSPFYSFILWHGASKKLNQSLDFQYQIDGIIYLDQEIAMAEPAWQEMQERMQKMLRTNPRFLWQCIQDSYACDSHLWETITSWQSFDWSKMSLDELLPYWEEYLQQTYAFTAYLLLPLFVESDMESELKSLLQEELPEEAETAFQILTTPIKGGVAQEERLRLLQLAITPTDSDLERYLADFAWISNNAFDGHFMSHSNLKMRLAEVQASPQEEYARLLEKQQELRNEYDRLYAQLSNNQTTLDLIDTLQESIYFRSWRTERYYRNAYYLQGLFQRISVLLKLEKAEDLFFLTPTEITEGLGSGEIRQKIALRKAGYALYADKEQTVTVEGEALQQWKKELLLKSSEQGKTLKGQVAYPGKVRGVARVIVDKSQLDTVQSGEILVTPSTTVDYVPILKRVAAIITDEGGVLSHASVISRELHLPCIIGTKSGTSQIKDGDILEIDATIGLINIIQ